MATKYPSIMGNTNKFAKSAAAGSISPMSKAFAIPSGAQQAKGISQAFRYTKMMQDAPKPETFASNNAAPKFTSRPLSGAPSAAVKAGAAGVAGGMAAVLGAGAIAAYAIHKKGKEVNNDLRDMNQKTVDEIQAQGKATMARRAASASAARPAMRLMRNVGDYSALQAKDRILANKKK